MNELSFQKWNKILGWVVFIISLSVYLLTIEPTNSFWDVGEYIATSSKLQIGHPPGAPLFQIIGAFASVFTSNPKEIAMTLNCTSAIASAFTILFMFWSIVILVRKLESKDSALNNNKAIIILGSGFVGSLAYTFTDSFWFNAVEAEVYAMATCILALLFYLGLLWERDMHLARGNKWLILISFIVGLSFGIHFMGLLSIPAIGLLYYFKNWKDITLKNFIIGNFIAVAILLFIFKLLVPYTLKFFSLSEVFFINVMGLPFNSGTIIAGGIVTILFYLGIKHTRKKQYPFLNTIVLSILFILIGFSSWVMIPIRANAGTVINENNPNNARELLAYYNLEQYPKTHLFYGPLFTEIYAHLDENNPYEDDNPKYEKDEKTRKYNIVNDWKNAKQNLDDRHKTFFPRMWSTEHIVNYMKFTGPIKFTIKPEFHKEKEILNTVNDFSKAYVNGKLDDEDYDQFLKSFGNYLDIERPSVWDNLKFMFTYQMGYMYWRYFMWNFVGRQNDIQGKLTNQNGNWLSGIQFIDEIHLGSQKKLPSDVLKNKARNTYYFLPFLLGLIGLVYQIKHDKKNFWVLFVFFLFTGLALKIYLNEKPFEVRERDYALVGSFYVFAIWIGIGLYALFNTMKNFIKPKIATPLILILCLLAGPIMLATQNWDDHDRSNRYTAQSMAKMYLSSCQENAILFTIGDNDTFPLWYVQDIEEYRTDIRVIISAYLGTDWYTDQMKKAAYKSKPISSQLTHKFYAYGNNDVIYHKPITKDTMLIKNWLKWIVSDDPRTKGDLQSGKRVNTFPTQHIRIPVDKQAVLKNGIVSSKDADKIVPYIDIHLKGDYLLKHRLLMLDILANNNWERPIYFSGGSFGDDDYIWMKEYLQLDGLVYKLVPIQTKIDPKNPYEMGRIDTEAMYPIVKNWDWGNGESATIYHDPQTRRNGISYRSSISRLAEELIEENKINKAKEILDLGIQKTPVEYYGYYTLLHPFVSSYYSINEKEKARDLYTTITKKYQEQLIYYGNLSIKEQYEYAQEIVTQIEYYRNLIDILFISKDNNFADIKVEEFNTYISLFSRLYGDSDYIEHESDNEQERDSNIQFKD
ncbi:glycosyltransferase family 117 protein [Aquimarina algiphila]|uniref:glycosyltransferase family 117 protein n=1 Tax=Aquimarina algiphila TaxID=2047982 RepID=UPI0024937ECF|nr:DUF2723 domain-containing protein [Aquimarina algiphila]